MSDEHLTFARELALEAGEVLRAGFGRVREVQTKGSHVDLLTEYDLRAEELVLQRIQERDPGATILAEESGWHGEGDDMWVVDPLDGTTNFAHGLPIFCISIAHLRNGQPDAGVVYAPILDEFFTVAAGEGAYMNDQRLEVSAVANVEQSLVVTGFPYGMNARRENNLAYFEAFSTRAQAVRRLGSAALDLCYVAAGRLDGYWEIETMPWDCSAGALLVREAGGVVTDMRGEALRFNGPTSVLATNGRIHAAMLEVMEGTRAAEG